MDIGQPFPYDRGGAIGAQRKGLRAGLPMLSGCRVWHVLPYSNELLQCNIVLIDRASPTVSPRQEGTRRTAAKLAKPPSLLQSDIYLTSTLYAHNHVIACHHITASYIAITGPSRPLHVGPIESSKANRKSPLRGFIMSLAHIDRASCQRLPVPCHGLPCLLVAHLLSTHAHIVMCCF